MKSVHGQNSKSENEQIKSGGDLFDTEEIERDYMFNTDDEEENILNVCRQKRRRFLADFESESDQNVQNTEVAFDGTVWQQIKGKQLEDHYIVSNKYKVQRHTPNEILYLVKQKQHFH